MWGCLLLGALRAPCGATGRTCSSSSLPHPHTGARDSITRACSARLRGCCGTAGGGGTPGRAERVAGPRVARAAHAAPSQGSSHSRPFRDAPLTNALTLPLPWRRGRNLEGQCGTEGAAVVPRPTAVLELHGQDLRALSASRFTSVAVAADGSVYTWGDGWGGKLGQGHTDVVAAPGRVSGRGGGRVEGW